MWRDVLRRICHEPSVNNMSFEQGIDYRAWWIDGGGEAPIAIRIGSGDDPAFIERAEAVLDTVIFDSIGPNPIPAEGELWAAGIPSDVPAGSVTLPVGPGVTFELSERAFVIQQEYKARVLPDAPGEVDIFFPDLAFTANPWRQSTMSSLPSNSSPTSTPPSPARAKDVGGLKRRNSRSPTPPNPAPMFRRHSSDGLP